MNANAQARVTRTLVGAEDLERFRRTTGRDGLAALIRALRSLVQILLKPFRAIAKLKYGSGNAEGPVEAQPAGANALAGVGQDEVALPNSAPNEAALASQLLDGAADCLQLELAGEQKELDEIMPMLQRHMELLLKDHLPKDVSESSLMDRLGTVAEAAERGRFAHLIATRQVSQALDHLAAQKQYAGMSQRAISELVLMGVKTKEGRALFVDGTPEATLLMRMAFKDHVEQTYTAQVRHIALLVLRGSDAAGTEVKLAHVLDAAAQTAKRFASRFPNALREADDRTLASFEEALRSAMAEGVEALEKASQEAAAALAAKTPAPAPAAPAAAVPAKSVVPTAVAKPAARAAATHGVAGFGGTVSQAQRDAERAAVAEDLDDVGMVMD